MTLNNYNSNGVSKPQLTTRTEIIECLAVIKVIHPNWDTDTNIAANIWHHEFATDDPLIVKRAVLSVSKKSVYIPKINEVRKEVDLLTSALNRELNMSEEEKQCRADCEWWYALSTEEMNIIIVNTDKWIKGELVPEVENDRRILKRAMLLKRLKEKLERKE